ncbi:hypothetical protein M378DRAFT_170163, partial [Amanita muscaria Koide BX008]
MYTKTFHPPVDARALEISSYATATRGTRVAFLAVIGLYASFQGSERSGEEDEAEGSTLMSSCTRGRKRDKIVTICRYAHT